MTPPWQTGQPALEEGSTYLGRLERPDQHDPRDVVARHLPPVVVVAVDIASLSRDLRLVAMVSPPKIGSFMKSTELYPRKYNQGSRIH